MTTPKQTLEQYIASNKIKSALYNSAELRPFDGRPNAMDAYALPSLVAGVSTPRAMPICTPTTKQV